MSAAEQLGFDNMPRRLVRATPTRLTGWLDCPRRYRFTYLERPTPQKGPPWAHNSLGAAVHTALAQWWRLPVPRRTPEAAGALLVNGWLTDGFRDREQSERWRELAREMVEDYAAGLDPSDEPIGVERTVALRTPVLALSGRADRIDERLPTTPDDADDDADAWPRSSAATAVTGKAAAGSASASATPGTASTGSASATPGTGAPATGTAAAHTPPTSPALAASASGTQASGTSASGTSASGTAASGTAATGSASATPGTASTSSALAAPGAGAPATGAPATGSVSGASAADVQAAGLPTGGGHAAAGSAAGSAAISRSAAASTTRAPATTAPAATAPVAAGESPTVELVIVDYKTGRHVPTTDDARGSLALAVYAAAAQATLRKPCRRVELHHLPSRTVVSWQHTTQSLTRHLDRANAIGEEVAEAEAAYPNLRGDEVDALFPPRPGPQCRWCDFAAHCPQGREAYPTRRSWEALATDESGPVRVGVRETQNG